MLNRVSRPFAPRQPDGSHLWHFIRLSQLSKLQTFLKWGIWLARLDQFKDEREGKRVASGDFALTMLTPKSGSAFGLG